MNRKKNWKVKRWSDRRSVVFRTGSGRGGRISQTDGKNGQKRWKLQKGRGALITILVLAGLLLPQMSLLTTFADSSENSDGSKGAAAGEKVIVDVWIEGKGSVGGHDSDYAEEVAYGSDLVLEMEADEGYVISAIRLNDEELDDSDMEELKGKRSGKLTLEEVEEETDVEVVFAAKGAKTDPADDEDKEADSAGTRSTDDDEGEESDGPRADADDEETAGDEESDGPKADADDEETAGDEEADGSKTDADDEETAGDEEADGPKSNADSEEEKEGDTGKADADAADRTGSDDDPDQAGSNGDAATDADVDSSDDEEAGSDGEPGGRDAAGTDDKSGGADSSAAQAGHMAASQTAGQGQIQQVGANGEGGYRYGNGAGGSPRTGDSFPIGLCSLPLLSMLAAGLPFWRRRGNRKGV